MCLLPPRGVTWEEVANTHMECWPLPAKRRLFSGSLQAFLPEHSYCECDTEHCDEHTLKLYNDDCTANAARTKDKHQSDSEETHLRNYIAATRLHLSTLYIVDKYMYLHTCNEVIAA